MLRTSMATAGARGARQLFSPSRIGLRTQFFPLRTPHTLTQRTFTKRATRKPPSFTFSSHPQPSPATLFQRLRASIRSFHSSRTRLGAEPTPANAASEAEPTTLSGRMKKLSREYGWSALGVYLGLTALDFPFCYLLVRYLGTDKIGMFNFLRQCRDVFRSSRKLALLLPIYYARPTRSNSPVQENGSMSSFPTSIKSSPSPSRIHGTNGDPQ